MAIIIPSKVNPLVLSYPDFTLGAIINPDEFDQNNLDVQDKLNEFIITINTTIDNTVELETIVNGANANSATALSTANTALANSTTAIGTANTAASNSAIAVATANTADANATTALNKATQVEADYTALKPELEQAVLDVADKASVAYVDTQIDTCVDLTSDQLIDGNKSFAQKLVVPYPVGDTHAATKKYVDDVAQGLVLSGVADGSVIDVKLGNSPTDIKQRFSDFKVSVESILPNKSNVGHTHLKSEVGLTSVDNTSDADKPVSTAQQAALDLKANLASPTFTGDPKAPTPATSDNDTTIATTAYVKAQSIRGSATVTNASWVASGNADYPYKKNVAITGVVAADYPSLVAFTLATLPIAKDAKMEVVECYAGGITLYGTASTPTGSVTFDYIIDKG